MYKIIRKSTLLCLFFAAASLVYPQSHQQSVIERISWQGAELGVVIAIITFFVILFAFLLLFALNVKRKKSKTLRKLSVKLFNEGCNRYRLTVEEAQLLREISTYSPHSAVDSHEIFEMQPLFEFCVDVYIRRVQSTVGPTEAQAEILRGVRRKLGYDFLAPERAITSTRNLNIGLNVTVSHTGRQNTALSLSAVVTYVDELDFTVSPSSGTFDFSNSHSDMDMVITFLRQGDASYSVPVKAKEVSAGGIKFFHTLEFSRNQSRHYMRLDVALPIKYRILEKAYEDSGKSSAEMHQVRSSDIGGGGLSFISDKPLTVGDVILLSLSLPGYPMNGIKSKVLKVITLEGRKQMQYKHLVQFIAIEPQQQEHIVKYIFEKQREMLQMR